MIELGGADEKVSYNGAKGAYAVKVYDASMSQMSDQFLKNIADAGMFIICRADVSDLTVDDAYINKRVEFDGYEDRMGAAMFISDDFDLLSPFPDDLEQAAIMMHSRFISFQMIKGERLLKAN